MRISIKNPDQVIYWLEIKNGRGILIYSTWKELMELI